MAKLQQMNETSKQMSQIFLHNGYWTYEGKRYAECAPFEKNAYNEALHRALRPEKKEKPFINFIGMHKEDYTPDGKVSKAMFDCLAKKAQPIEGNNSDMFGIEATHGVYSLYVVGEWVWKYVGQKTIAITCNESYVLYRGAYYDLHFTQAQEDVLIDLLSKEYERQEREEEEARWAYYYESERRKAYADEMDTLTSDWYQP